MKPVHPNADGIKSVQIKLLGKFMISTAAEEVRLVTRKAESLFAFLTIQQNKAVSRERLLGAIWPDWEENRARSNLSTAIWRIRQATRATPSITIGASKDAVSLSLDENVQVDVVSIHRMLTAARTQSFEERLRLLEQAEAAQAGDFLEGCTDEWCDEERRSWHRIRVETLRMLVQACEEKRDDSGSTGYLEKLLTLEPLDEDAQSKLMRAYYSQGNRAFALRQYDRFKELLRNELGIEPSDETTKVWQQMKAQPQVAKRISPLGSVTAGAGPEFVVDGPLVGRRDSLARLVRGLIDASAERGSVQLITGDIGIGKTRLAEAVANEGRIRGFEVLIGACQAAPGPPYQAIIQALWPRISRSQVSSTWMSPIIDRIVRTLMPETSSANRRRRGSVFSVDSALVNECLVSLLVDEARSIPTLLILEDLHNVDRATEGLLSHLIGRARGEDLFVIGTMRTLESQSERLLRRFAALGADETELGPLTRLEIKDLIQGALQTPLVSEQLAKFVGDRSSGVPLFALELLKFLAAKGCLIRDGQGRFVADEDQLQASVPSVPFGVAEVIRRRIRLVGPEACSILSAAAVLGSEVRYDILEEFIGVPEEEFIANVERLIEVRLLQETERGLRFPHEATRLAGLTFLSAARLRKLHVRAAVLLERASPARSEDIAWHWDQAGEASKALSFYEISGDKARMIHANEDAFRWYSRGLDAIDRIEDSEREPELLRRRAFLLIKRQEVLDLMGRRLEQSEDAQAILLIARKLEDHRLAGEGELLRSQVLCRLNMNTDAIVSAQRAVGLFQSVSDSRGQARAYESLGVAHMNSRNQREAGRVFRRGLVLYRRAKDRSGEARCLVSLGTLASFDGRILRSMEYLDEGERILNEIRDRRSLAGALLQKGVLYRFLGMNDRSKAYLGNGIAILEEIGDRIGQARGMSQMAFTNIASGDLRAALRESLAAVNIARKAKDVRAQIVFLNNIAYGAYRCLGDFGRAAKSVLEAIKLATQVPGAENIATYYDTMAAILLDQGDYAEALRWAQQAHALYRTWDAQFNYVGAGIYLRLGVAYMHCGRGSRAKPLLLRALSYWKSGGDLELRAHGVAELGLLYLKRGDMSHALECAREVERLMRRVDGIEQAQGVYWAQYQIYRSAGMNAAARRALNRASASVAQQSASLKGLLRRKHAAIGVNQAIVRETSDAKIRAAVQGRVHRVAEAGKPRTREDMKVAERRQALVMLLARGAIGQSELANRLGVSPRTIRHDLSVLRSQGFLQELLPRQLEV